MSSHSTQAAPGPGLSQAEYDELMGYRVRDRHVFTARMCAASRCLESRRRDRLYEDPLSELLAGWEGMDSPMGDWILTPRTAYGDNVLKRAYNDSADGVERHASPAAARQLVALGAGMDARAYRPELNVPEMRVFEVDHGENFRVKEAILQHPGVQASFPLATRSRHVVSTDFADTEDPRTDSLPRWARDLRAAGYDPTVPTVWLLEGLLMYLTMPQQVRLARAIGQLSCAGSVVFHDAISASYVSKRIAVAGAPFVGGCNDYLAFWRQHAGFAGRQSAMRSIQELRVDRWERRLRMWSPRNDEVARACARGHDVVLFVEAWKGPE